MTLELIQHQLLALPQVAVWPELRALVSRPARKRSTAVWEIPAVVCGAVGGESAAALPASAAIYCALLSIHLVDDLLDSDPHGLYHRVGVGPAANMALALDAAGHRMLSSCVVPSAELAQLHAELASMSLATAYGQHLDGLEVKSEEDYWRVVAAKTPPLFRAAFRLGAAVGGAAVPTREGLARVGDLMGRIVQVSDDLGDAMATPASADWRRPGANLALLYALTSNHPERDQLARLAPLVAEDPASLEEAQSILLGCGAASYCAYLLLGFARQARDELNTLVDLDARPLLAVVEEHLRPLFRLLATAGVDSPEALFEV